MNLLKNAVESVLQQDFNNWELLVIDDGSEDETPAYIHSLDDKRIRYFKELHSGKGPARNKGLKMAHGRYICFLDSDDIYFQHHLSALEKSINENPQFKIFRTEICWNINGQISRQVPIIANNKEKQLRALWMNFFCLQNMSFAKEICSKVVFKDYPLWQDKQFIQKIIIKYPYFQIDDCTVQLNEGEERSVNKAFLNPELVQKQIECILESSTELHTKNPDVAKKLNVDLIIAKTYINHLVNARLKQNLKLFFYYFKKVLGRTQNPKIILRLFLESLKLIYARFYSKHRKMRLNIIC